MPVEVDAVTPTSLLGKSTAEIERLLIQHGNRRVALAELFRVAGDPADEQLTFVGDLSGVHGIGMNLDRGTVRVEGHAGRHVGSEMTAGEIHVFGNAGDWLGGEMHGGLIDVHGDAGDLVGSAYRGSARGMTGGTLLVRGNAGRELGLSMRRGLIAVGGNTGDFPGLNMIAGSILVFGTTGRSAAAGMHRGTVAVFGKPPTLPGTFRSGGACTVRFLRLYFAELRRLGFPVPAELDRAVMQIFSGDLLTVGKGEVLTRAD